MFEYNTAELSGVNDIFTFFDHKKSVQNHCRLYFSSFILILFNCIDPCLTAWSTSCMESIAIQKITTSKHVFRLSMLFHQTFQVAGRWRPPMTRASIDSPHPPHTAQTWGPWFPYMPHFGYIYIYIYICICTHICVHICIYIYTYIYKYISYIND